MSEQEPFLKRWSRVKTEQKEQVKAPPSQVASNPQEISISHSKRKELEEKLVSELPPVESLTKDSDFTAFLRKGVPEALRQQALHKLWASDPAFAAPDPLDFQNVDYTKLVTNEVVTTSYEVGKGFADRVEAEMGGDGRETGEPPAKDATTQVGTTQVGTTQVGTTQVGATQVGATQVDSVSPGSEATCKAADPGREHADVPHAKGEKA